jgi:hypothetical protein
MRLDEIFLPEEGRIVKGVNTTCDVGTNEIAVQSSKFCLDVTKDGIPVRVFNKTHPRDMLIKCEKHPLAESTQSDYRAFVAQWGDYVLELMFAEPEYLDDAREEWEGQGKKFSTKAWLKEFYAQERKDILTLNGKQIYRGVAVEDDWLTAFRSGTAQVGRHWSLRQEIAKSFTSPGGNYDERFHKGGQNRVILVGRINLANVDVNHTIATHSTASEAEVVMHENAPVHIETIIWNGQATQVGRDYPA